MTRKNRIDIHGLGVVGACTAIQCMEQGWAVRGFDPSEKISAAFDEVAQNPWPEPVIFQKITEMKSTGAEFSVSEKPEAKNVADVSIVCVGTPNCSRGGVDLEPLTAAVRAVLTGVKNNQERFCTMIVRSTIPPGTSRNVIFPMIEEALGEEWRNRFSYVLLPEFLREGQALSDTSAPSIKIFASTNLSAKALLKDLFGLSFSQVKLELAEMIKYYNNSFHALKVAFANEVATVAESYGVNAAELTELFLSDTTLNISPAYLKPGFAYGGSCLPKDLSCLRVMSENKKLATPIIAAIEASNNSHIDRFVRKIVAKEPKVLGVLGLSFKAGSMNLKNSPMISLLEKVRESTPPPEDIFGWSPHGWDAQWPQWISPAVSVEEVLQKCDTLLVGHADLSEEQHKLLKKFKGSLVDVNDLSPDTEAQDQPTDRLSMVEGIRA